MSYKWSHYSIFYSQHKIYVLHPVFPTTTIGLLQGVQLVSIDNFTTFVWPKSFVLLANYSFSNFNNRFSNFSLCLGVKWSSLTHFSGSALICALGSAVFVSISYSVIEDILKLCKSSATSIVCTVYKINVLSVWFTSTMGILFLFVTFVIKLAANRPSCSNIFFSESIGVIIYSLYLGFPTICERLWLTV